MTKDGTGAKVIASVILGLGGVLTLAWVFLLGWLAVKLLHLI